MNSKNINTKMWSKRNMTIVALTTLGLGAALLLGGGIYVTQKRKKELGIGRKVAGTSQQEVIDKAELVCGQDSTCAGFVYDKNNISYTLLTDKAAIFANAVDDPNFDLYVKRPEGQNISTWSDWTPPTCPSCGSATRTRTCSGGMQCPGKSTASCGPLPPCQSFYQVPDGYKPYGTYTAMKKTTAVDAATCVSACDGTSGCLAAAYSPQSKACSLYSTTYTAITPTTFDDIIDANEYYRVYNQEDDKLLGDLGKCDGKCGTIPRRCIAPSGQEYKCKSANTIQATVCAPCASFDFFPSMKL